MDRSGRKLIEEVGDSPQAHNGRVKEIVMEVWEQVDIALEGVMFKTDEQREARALDMFTHLYS